MMMTQESQVDCDVNIHFVIPNHLESENDCSEEMWLAYNKCSELGLEPNWVIEKICDQMKPSKNDVFIIEEFNGILFEKLKNFKCSIVSPKCLLICFLNGEPIPEGRSPIYTTSMRNMCICTSGLSSEIKNQIQQRIEYMGGVFTKQLRSSVTHLIADSVMSAKYECAIEMKIPIMTKEWIEAVWEANLKSMVQANDKIFDKYKCPVFKNLIVTSTNLSKRQKEEVKHLIHDHGGTFMGPLDGTKVRVVLASANGPISDKLKYAMENDIACLKPDWVYESIKVGYALPFHNFIIKSMKACSTPEKYTRETLNCSEISSIPHDRYQNNYINETHNTTSNFSIVDAVPNNFSNNAMLNVLNRLTFSEAKSAGPFLDGCNIYLAGFATNIKDKLNRILNVGGATRFDDISDAVTHVIVGDESKASMNLKAMKMKCLSPYVLNIEWLEESMKLKRPAPEDRFLFGVNSGTPKKNIETPASPLSQKNLQMLQPPKRPPIPLFNLEKEVALSNEKQQSDLVQQYLQKTNDCSGVMQEYTKLHISISQDKNAANTSNANEIRSSDTTQIKNTNDDSSVPLSQSCTINEKLLRGLTFVVVDFDKEDNNVKETIEMLGGRVVSKTYSGIPDYGVVPLQGAPLKYTVNEIVTDLFIEDCINQERVVDIEYYHKPFSLRKPCSPLSGCVITMSMYTGTERIYLSALAKKLGAICQDMFARKANAEKNTHGSTHLVCPTPEGNKYNAAVRWKLPAVTADWLKTCADQLTLVDETPFLVGETMAPDRLNTTSNETILNQTPSSAQENKTNLPEEVTTRTILTPKRNLPQVKEMFTVETPLINKRLSSVMNQTPNSPFHVSTPDTPYGQVFKSNPSPDTRKGWIKWVDNFPDLQVAEPPLKRRAPSTPLSDLKKQLWEKLKNAGQSEKRDAANEPIMRSNDSPAEKAAEEETDPFNINAPSTYASEPINRKLDFDEASSPVSNKSSNEINMQIAKLDQILQQTSRNSENRYSISGESTNKYDVETSDDIQKCIIKDSQPIDAIVWEDPNHPKQLSLNKQTSEDVYVNVTEEHNEEDITEYQPPMIRRFMLSGIKDKKAYEQVILELGGDVSTDPKYDNNATHLLCIRLSRNEKMLGSIAAGKWLIHCSYLRDCEQEGRFLDEEKYEWGNPKSKGMIPEPNGEIEQAIAAAAYKWRLRLQNESNGPFSDMVALLMVSEDKYDQFKRLIEAGGGSVTQARPPYDASSSGRRITHCFVNVKQVKQPVDWAMLASKGILCFLPQYLSDYLMAVEPLNPRDCVLPEFKKYLALLPK
ncbi:DNA topoisomerase 2-binding protein 1-A isoform X2 [Nylanderia fulva]|uniref:DNA topoisomerase 2-binding protein 1-A isoform X2 n=1 Tax=Nylanderia fulva TaxID=613905 RepID=UPI0010FB38CD|nr:DNA topoisomerase 2-binding protein 1-A isoform X2 [Nylanderia fulva]